MALLPHSPSSTVTILLVSLLLHTIAALLPAEQSEQLVGEYFTQPQREQPPGDSRENREPRILELLQLRQIVNGILKDPDWDKKPMEPWDSPGTPNNMPAPTTKRVFCNHYTGCGGRFRGRRRMVQKTVGKRTTSKKPFCNHFGCGNGKKRFDQPVPVGELTTAELHAHAKRLFCNIYGGCQNFGKRDETSKLGSNAASFEDQRELPQPKLKRFLNGGYDRNMQALIDSLRK